MNDSSLQYLTKEIFKFSIQKQQSPSFVSQNLDTSLWHFIAKQLFQLTYENEPDQKNLFDFISKSTIKKEFKSMELKSIVQQISRIKSKFKYPIALIIVSILSQYKQKSFSVLLGFYYELLNNLIKELRKEEDQSKKNANKKINQEQVLRIQEISRTIIEWTLKFFQILIKNNNQAKKIEVSEQNKEYEIVSSYLKNYFKNNSGTKSFEQFFRPSKILKITTSLLCLPQKYLTPSHLIHTMNNLLENYSHSHEILSKIQYKLTNKFQKYDKQLFTQTDIWLLFKIILSGVNPQARKIIDKFFRNQGQIAAQNFNHKQKSPNIKENILRLVELMTNSSNISIKGNQNQNSSKENHSFGYHLTYFILNVVSKQSFLSQTDNYQSAKLIKQIIFFISTNFLHHIHSSSTQKQNIKFYNTIISTLICQTDVFILKLCLNFVQNQAILNFSVHKLKSLFKLLTDIAKKLKKMDSNNIKKSNKCLKQQKNCITNQSNKEHLQRQVITVNEQIQLAKLKISRILRIFDEITQRFRDKSSQINFQNASQSFLTLQKIKCSNSCIFYVRINDKRKFNCFQQNFQSKKKVTDSFNERMRLVKFVIAKSETYQIFIRIKPSFSNKQRFTRKVIHPENKISQGRQKNLFDQIIFSEVLSYTTEIQVCQDKDIVLKQQLKNIEKVADSHFQFTLCVSCNKSADSKGSNLLVKLNQKLMSIPMKQKKNQITSLQLGLSIEKSSQQITSLNSVMKHFYLFNKQIPQNLMKKNDFCSIYTSTNYLLQVLGGIDAITYKVSSSSQQLIEDLKKQQSLFFKKQLKLTSLLIQKRRSISFIQIFQQIGGLNSIFYILEKINKSYATHFGQKTQYFFIELFKILKNVGSYDRESFIFKELKNCYSYIFHFLVLIFKRNQYLANQRNYLFVQALFKFIMFFSSQFTKNETIKQYPLDQVLEMQLTFVKQVLCNFELWSECSIEIQSYIFQTLQGFIKNEKYTFVMFPIDLHSKILSSVTFFYCQQPYNILKNKFQQRILMLCEIMYDKIINLLCDEKNNLQNTYNLDLLFKLLKKIVSNQNKDQLLMIASQTSEKEKQKGQYKQVTTKKDLMSLFQRYIHRDVNQTIGLINLLLIYHSKHFKQNVNISVKNMKESTQFSPKQQKSNCKMEPSSEIKKSFALPSLSVVNSTLYLPSSLRTCSNLLLYFSRNFVEKDQIFSTINQDWGYVLGIFTNFQQLLLKTRIFSKDFLQKKNVGSLDSCQFFIIGKIFDLIFKIINKNQVFFNYLINSIDRILMYNGLTLLECFQIVSEIISLNKKYNFDVVDTVFFLLNKKLKIIKQKNEISKILEFLAENELEKILYKMADGCLTESKEFQEFMSTIIKQIISLDGNYFSDNLLLNPSLVSVKASFVQNSPIKEKQRLQNQSPLIDSMDKMEIIQHQQRSKMLLNGNERQFKFQKSRQQLIRIFSQYKDILFSICYETGSISSRNRQWLEKYFQEKYQKQNNFSSIQNENLLKQKRINIQSNLLIAYYCSSEATVKLMFDVLERNASQQLQDILMQKKACLNKKVQKQLVTIEQFSPVKQVSNSYSSRLSQFHQREEIQIQTQEKINSKITKLLSESQPVSFFLSNPKLNFPAIHLFNKLLQQKLSNNIQYSFFSQKGNLSLLSFIRLYLLGSSLGYIVEKYSYSEQNHSQAQKPIDAIKRKQNTLHALQLITQFLSNNLLDLDGFYNCLQGQLQISTFKNQKALIADWLNFSEEKTTKVFKQVQQNLKKFLELWYVDTNKDFKVNLHDRQRIKSPKKLNLQEKNCYDTFFDKIKFICFEVKNDDQKINELFTFMTENTQNNVAKSFLNLMNKIISTLKFVMESKYLLTLLQNFKFLYNQSFPISCPKNPSLVFARNLIQQYTGQVIQRFNKILQIERRKCERCEKQYGKNEKENQFWLQIQEKDYERKDVIYQIDQKEMGPFGFYKLNIKPSEERMQQIHYPRRKMFVSIKDSDGSQQNEQEQNQQDESVLLTRTRLIQMSLDNNYLQEKNQRRNTLLEASPIKNVLDPGMQRNSILINNPGNKVVQFYCEWVTKRGVYAGKLVVKSDWIEFKYLSHLRLPDEIVYKMSTAKFHQINSLTEQELLNISSIRIAYKRCKLFTRRYILRHTAVELFSKTNHQSYFFNLFYNSERQKLISLTRQKFQDCLEDRKQQFNKKKFTQQWQIGQLSNFEYLCLINQYSGRSTNDLAQYYVFPWVITNHDGKYNCFELDQTFLSKKQNLRDLSCPPGKLSQEKFTKLKMRLMQLDFCEPQQRFLYGTMFSNPTVLYNFFIRLEPYIHLHWEHQGKRIDHADRLFSSIQQQFSSVLIASSDMKQLTPEFYYWPQFLKNRSYIDLGQKQNKQQVDDVILPVWAHTPQQFIFKMRYALQSNVVSEHLHQWIDLTFGYKIKYENAEKYDNLYHFNCYERENDYFEEFQEDQKQIRSLQVSISEFGQIPQAIFDERHPVKNLRHQFLIIDRAIHVRYQKSSSKTIDLNLKRGFETCKQGLFVWTSKSVEFKKSYITQNYSYDEEHRVFSSIGGYVRLLSFQDQCWLTLNQGILRVYLKRVQKYENQIQAQCIDIIGTYFVYSRKSSLYISQYDGNLNRLINKKTLFGHKDEIIYLTCSKSLDLILSVDLQGFVIVHELQNLAFLRNFQLPLEYQWSKNQIRSDSYKSNILKVQIHQMGYFIFLLNQRKLVIFTFLGEKFLQHDIEITSDLKSKKQEEKINDMLIFRQDQSLLLLGTNRGNIYLVDFIEIKRYNQIYPHKTFTNIQNNILEIFLQHHQSSVMKSTVSKKSSHNETISKPIFRMSIQKIPGDKICLYQLIVQYEDGEIVCFYEQRYLGKQLKQNEKLKQIGLFF